MNTKLSEQLNKFSELQKLYNSDNDELSQKSDEEKGGCSKDLKKRDNKLKEEYKALHDLAEEIRNTVLNELSEKYEGKNDPDSISEYNRNKCKIEELFKNSNDADKWREEFEKIGL